MGKILWWPWWLTRQGRSEREKRSILKGYLEAALQTRSAILSYCINPCGQIENLFAVLACWTKAYVRAGYAEVPLAEILRHGSTEPLTIVAALGLRRTGPLPAKLDIDGLQARLFTSTRSPANLRERLLQYLKEVLPAEQFGRMFPAEINQPMTAPSRPACPLAS